MHLHLLSGICPKGSTAETVRRAWLSGVVVYGPLLATLSFTISVVYRTRHFITSSGLLTSGYATLGYTCVFYDLLGSDLTASTFELFTPVNPSTLARRTHPSSLFLPTLSSCPNLDASPSRLPGGASRGMC